MKSPWKIHQWYDLATTIVSYKYVDGTFHNIQLQATYPIDNVVYFTFTKWEKVECQRWQSWSLVQWWHSGLDEKMC